MSLGSEQTSTGLAAQGTPLTYGTRCAVQSASRKALVIESSTSFACLPLVSLPLDEHVDNVEVVD